MGKILRNTKIAKQNRKYVNYHRDWKRISINESIRSTAASSFASNPSTSQGHTMTSSDNDGISGAQDKLRR